MNYLEKFDINVIDIPSEVIKIKEKLTKKQVSVIVKRYESLDNLIYTIYYLKFIKKYETSEIAKELGIAPQNVHAYFYTFHWCFDDNYEKNQKKYFEELIILNEMLNDARIFAEEVNISDYKELENLIINRPNLRRDSFEWCGCKDAVDYIKLMYYLNDIMDLTSVQLTTLFDESFTTIQDRIHKIGLRENVQDAIKKKKRNNRQDYEKSKISGLKTRVNSYSLNCLGGSKNENVVRALLSLNMSDYLGSSLYEVVVGVNNIGILSAKEIDIPVVVIRRSDNFVYKFAIEYNGDVYHVDETDDEKKRIAYNRGWEYISLTESNKNQYSNNTEKLKNEVYKVCEKIKCIVETN